MHRHAAALCALALLVAACVARAWPYDTDVPEVDFHELQATLVDGTTFDFERLRGRYVAVVNVASECGYTESGYEDLAKVQYTEDWDFLVFPSNDFGAQEPGPAAAAMALARDTYGLRVDSEHVHFFQKANISMGKPGRHPVFLWIDRNMPQAGGTKWNFEKFAVDPHGKPLVRLNSAASLTEYVHTLQANREDL